MFGWFESWLHGGFKLFQHLHAYLLDQGFPDLIWHPGWRALGLLYLLPLSGEYVNFLCSSFSQLDISMAPICGLEPKLRPF